MSFKEKLDEKSLEVFNAAATAPFSAQAVFFLNAFWEEHGSCAEYVFSIAWDIMKKVDMESKGIHYFHKYTEGVDLDFDLSLHCFEKMSKFFDSAEGGGGDKDQKVWAKEHKDWQEEFKACKPTMMTSIVRKKKLRDEVDVNFNGRMCFLEYLLYQFQATPKDLLARMQNNDEDEDVRKARLALEEVNKQIMAYEGEKTRLEEIIETGGGVKKMKAKNELAQLLSGPIAEALNAALITAEAAVRAAVKKSKNNKGEGGAGANSSRTDGAVWWMQRDLEDKKKKYGKKKK